MKENYYNTFATGLIDSLLIRLNEHTDYLVPVRDTDTTDGDIVDAAKKGKLVRPDYAGSDFTWMEGKGLGTYEGKNMKKPITYKKIGIDATVHKYLLKQEMKPSMGDIDYSHEYASPFPDSVNKTLLLLKWITGIQSITGDTVVITKKELAKIGYDHISPLQLKIQFDKLFGYHKITEYHKSFYSGCLTYNYYNEDTKEWSVKIGSREMRYIRGAGTVILKTTQYFNLMTKIITYHRELLKASLAVAE